MSLIAEARSLILRADQAGSGGLLVFLSGGKDSLVILDLAVWAGVRVECVFMYMVAGLRCVEEPVEAAMRRYPKVPLHKVPHWNLSRALAYGDMCVAHNDVRILRIGDIERAMRKKTGIDWVASGERSSDSFTRTQYVGKCKGWNQKSQHIFPVWNWKTEDIVTYLRARKIPLPPRYGDSSGDLHGTSGFSLQADSIRWLYRNHPDDYARVEKIFPKVGTVIARDRFMVRRAKDGSHQVSEVRATAGVAQGNQERPV